MPSFQAFQALLQQATARGSKSTVMRPLEWLIGILVAGLVGALAYDAPAWLLATLAAFIGLSCLVYLVAYAAFGYVNPDLLRSENYHLSKMAIEKNLIGDNVVGMREVADGQSLVQALEVPAKLEDRRDN